MELRIHAPHADRVVAEIDDGPSVELQRSGAEWIGAVPDGVRYAISAEGPAGATGGGRRSLVDPAATEVWFPDTHRRVAARPGRPSNVGCAPLAVAAPWPPRQAQRPTTRPRLVYEAHARGLTKRRDRTDAGTFSAAIGELARLRALGISVLELLPVHQYDPDEGNYWGYMPLVFGAIHRQYAAGEHPAAELADLVVAAHEHDIEVWLDVVFNHTTEEDGGGPTYNLRGLDERGYYVVRADGSYVDDAGTGNIVDARSRPVQRLIIGALDRLADLGVDGFRFDLAAVLTRDPAFVRDLGDWADRRGVRLIAEPWDLARYQLGRAFPDRRWAQWNGRFRDDMRSFLRGEPSMVPAVIRRVQGSPDLFDAPLDSINFLTSHDGYTMYDLVAYEQKHNQANGWDNADGADDNRSWNGGWEGDDQVPADVVAVRRRQLRNAMCLLLLSHGTPMFVAGDEFARTQGGNNNPYNQDNETSWIDWDRQAQWAEHECFVRRLIELRATHPVLWQTAPWGDRVEFYGTDASPDLGEHSRALAWHIDGLYVLANMWWEPLDFAVQVPGRWTVAIDTTVVAAEPASVGASRRVGPRSIVVLTSDR
ncbi:MAG: glycogen-debranching protein [Ilumatobacter sp.]|nr:glycogen-debranching protein [Ilumatobacter sp.]